MFKLVLLDLLTNCNLFFNLGCGWKEIDTTYRKKHLLVLSSYFEQSLFRGSRFTYLSVHSSVLAFYRRGDSRVEARRRHTQPRAGSITVGSVHCCYSLVFVS